MSTYTGVIHIGPHFYRLQIYGWEHGSVVEEREELQEVFAALESNHVKLVSVEPSEPGELRFKGTDRNGNDVRVAITFYQRSEPSHPLPDPESLLGKW